ncbi:hypothetical protein Tco_1194396, partial [Tanacetum coccineum]
SLSPDHVFDFPEDDPTHDLKDLDVNVEEDPEEDPEEEYEENPKILTLKTLKLRILLTELFRCHILVARSRWKDPYMCLHFYHAIRVGRMDAYDVDLSFIERDATRTSDGVLALQEENQSLRRRMDSLKMFGGGTVEILPSESIDVLAVYGIAKRTEPQGPLEDP